MCLNLSEYTKPGMIVSTDAHIQFHKVHWISSQQIPKLSESSQYC